jgi:hypothetical protein
VILEVFQSPEVREKRVKNTQIHMCGFHCVAKKREKEG